jgi:hypothetical protein
MQAAGRIQILDDRLAPRELAFHKSLDDFKAKYLALWQSATTEQPVLGERFKPCEQEVNEHQTDQLVQYVEAQLHCYPESPSDQEIWRTGIRERIKRFGRDCFRFPDHYLNVLLSDAYLRVTSTFAREAKAFNEELELDALSQAMRNIWVMNCLQMFLGKEISLSASIFAYSMLYPYTDNVLDDAEISGDSKREICRRLGLRLAGSTIEPASRHERDIYRLVAMIEDQYERVEFPEVFWVLLAIHRGQVRSLTQQGSDAPPEENRLLNISVEKGGASVLADGYLVAGKLSHAAAEFFFGFGVVLQLFDDLQDVTQDLEARRWTIFSRNAHVFPLDCIANRLHSFLLKVLRSAPRFPISFQRVLKDLIQRNCSFLLLQAVSQNQDLFSRNYLRILEPYSPVRFGYLKSLRTALAKKHEAFKQTILERRNLPSFYQLLS